MINRFGQVWASTVEAASVGAGDVYFLAGQEIIVGAGTPNATEFLEGSSASQSATSDADWDTPSNALTLDTISAEATLLSGYTESLFLTGFGFAIPAGALITGIKGQISHNVASGVYSGTVILRHNGTNLGTSVAITSAIAIDFEFTDISGITVTQINDLSFGVAFREYSSTATAVTVDYIILKIEYATYSDSDYGSVPLLVRLLNVELGFVNAAGSGEGEDAYVPVDIITGDYNTSAAVTLVGDTSPVVTNSVTVTKPQLYKGAYSQVVSASVRKRVYVNTRYPLNLDSLGIEKFTGNNGTTRVAGTDIPFVGLHFPTAVSKAMKLTLLSES